MAFDSHANLAVSTVVTAPVPPESGVSLGVAVGTATLFPTPPFNATVWPAGAAPTPTNAEIVRVTAIVGDTLTILRAQEGTTARSIITGDQICNSITVKVITDIESAVNALSDNADLRAADYAGAAPPWVPTGTLGIAVDTGTEQIWWYYSGAWR